MEWQPCIAVIVMSALALVLVWVLASHIKFYDKVFFYVMVREWAVRRAILYAQVLLF